MVRSFILPILALCMLVFAANHVYSRQRPIKQVPPPFVPPESQSSTIVAGAGIVEAKSENISIGSFVAGIVDKVLVRVGQRVAPGTPLFELDARQVQAELGVRRAELEASYAELSKLEQMPRPEDVPPVVARREEAEATVAEMKDSFNRANNLVSSGAATEEKVVISKSRLDAALAQLAQMKAEEARLLAGAWEADKQLARAQVQRSQRGVEQFEIELSRYRVEAPRTGLAGEPFNELTILQVNIHPGEPVAASPGIPLMVLGDTSVKHVRVDIDEHDIPRFNPNAPAEGIVRGETAQRYRLKFVRTEPFVVPKRSLTGDNRERVDTRVLQVIYAVVDEPTEHPVYIGQQMDVFVDISKKEHEQATK